MASSRCLSTLSTTFLAGGRGGGAKMPSPSLSRLVSDGERRWPGGAGAARGGAKENALLRDLLKD